MMELFQTVVHWAFPLSALIVSAAFTITAAINHSEEWQGKLIAICIVIGMTASFTLALDRLIELWSH